MTAELPVGLEVLVEIHVDRPLREYTSKVTKTILARSSPYPPLAFQRLKGAFKLFSITPPLEPVSLKPVYPRVPGLPEVRLGGDYVFRVAGPGSLIEVFRKSLEKTLDKEEKVGFRGARLTYTVKRISQVGALLIDLSRTSKIKIKLETPAILSNPLAPGPGYRRLAPTPLNLLWIPYLLSKGVETHRVEEVVRAFLDLESTLVEAHPMRTRVTTVYYGGNVIRGITGLVTYKVAHSQEGTTLPQVRGPHAPVSLALAYASLLGVGGSRSSGFGFVRIEASPTVDEIPVKQSELTAG